MLNFDQQREKLNYETRIVMGITKFKGTIDGSEIDSCSVLIAAPLDETTGNAKGFGVSKVSYGKSENYEPFRNLNFPCEMECAFVQTTNASGRSKETLKDIRPLKAKA